MKRIEKRPVPQKIIPAHTEDVVRIFCDFCGAEGKEKFDHEIDWGNSSFDVSTTAIYFKEGYNCPDGGSGEVSSFHICPKCWKEKFVPLLNKEGIQESAGEWDW